MTNMFEDVFNDMESTKSNNVVTQCDISEIYSINQDRKEFPNLDELAQSIAESGQETPIVVFPKDENGYRVIHGERRYRSIQLLNERGIEINPLIFIRENANANIMDGYAETNTRIGQIADNLQRENLLPSEMAAAITALMSPPHNLSSEVLQKKLGKAGSWISLNKKLSKASSDVLAVESAGIRDQNLLVTLVKIEELNPDLLKEYLARYDDYSTITRSETLKYFAEQKELIENPYGLPSCLSKKAKKSLSSGINNIINEREYNEAQQTSFLSSAFGIIESYPDNPKYNNELDAYYLLNDLKIHLVNNEDSQDSDSQDSDSQDSDSYDEEKAEFKSGVLSFAGFSTPISKENALKLFEQLEDWLSKEL